MNIHPWRYILQGHEPVQCPSAVEWARWFETADRRVAFDKIETVEISTVFLGLDHAFGLGPTPLLFETMVFGGPLNDEMQRYTTWDAAVVGHQRLVGEVRRALAERQEVYAPDMPPPLQRRIVLEN